MPGPLAYKQMSLTNKESWAGLLSVLIEGERSMATMFIRHTISDYKAWRKVYDDFTAIQKAEGVTAQAVYQAADNPNDITVTTSLALLKPHKLLPRVQN